MAKALSGPLPRSSEELNLLKRFDASFTQAAKYPNSKSTKDKFLEQEAKVTQKVLAKAGQLRDHLKEWDNEFFCNQLKTPSLKDYDDSGKRDLLLQHNRCKRLLRIWGVLF